MTWTCPLFQVSQVAEELEELLEGPTVSQAVGRMALNIISNLMDGASQALSASASRYKSRTQTHRRLLLLWVSEALPPAAPCLQADRCR